MINCNFLNLQKDVYFSYGYVNGLITDLRNGELYRLDKEAEDLLVEYLWNKRECADLSDGIIEELLANNLALIEKEPHKESSFSFEKKIDIVWFELRKACNLSCIHCYNSSNPYAERNLKVLSLEEWKSIVDQLIEFHPRTIVLIGGEPLLFNRIGELIEYIKEKISGTQLVVYSNLTILSDKTIELFKKSDIKVVTSVYSYSSRTHDVITQQKDSFDKTIEAIKRLTDVGIDVKANTVTMSINEAEMDETKRYLFEITGKKPKVDTIRNVNSELDELVPQNVKDTRLISNYMCLDIPTSERYIRNMNANPCWYGKINISCDGYVNPCIMCQKLDETLNVRENTLNNVLENVMTKYWNLSKDKIQVCNVCEYRYLCSDCRPLAKNIDNRYGNCLYNPFTGKWNVNRAILLEYMAAPKVEAKSNDCSVAFVCSCPGKIEKEKNALVQGRTGERLTMLIEELNVKMPLEFGNSKEDYFITNASNCVHYSALTGRSEPKDSEVLLPENLARLNTELHSRKIIITCGLKAKKAVEKLNLSGRIINICHLSARGLKNIGRNKSTTEKIKILAKQIINEVYANSTRKT